VLLFFVFFFFTTTYDFVALHHQSFWRGVQVLIADVSLYGVVGHQFRFGQPASSALLGYCLICLADVSTELFGER
jgi:hypothetical protein